MFVVVFSFINCKAVNTLLNPYTGSVHLFFEM